MADINMSFHKKIFFGDIPYEYGNGIKRTKLKDASEY